MPTDYHSFMIQQAAAEGAEYESMIDVTRSALSAEELAHELMARWADGEPLTKATRQALIKMAIGSPRNNH